MNASFGSVFKSYQRAFGISDKSETLLESAVMRWYGHESRTLFVFGKDYTNTTNPPKILKTTLIYPTDLEPCKELTTNEYITWCRQQYGIAEGVEHADELAILDRCIKEISSSIYLANETGTPEHFRLFDGMPMRIQTLSTLMQIFPNMGVGGICVSVTRAFGPALVGIEKWITKGDDDGRYAEEPAHA